PGYGIGLRSSRLPRGATSMAKARCSDAFVLAANEAVQMFGGVGMTDEYDVGFYLKRARVAEMTFGDAAWHRERFARLSGY
ncbi:MAG: acyl-CoA dehydrogenase family protein, partial [Proteobacteria bacterium]|nr:acyl-CoA dehydrogenase family protein [Pseudomonadota bacterium]